MCFRCEAISHVMNKDQKELETRPEYQRLIETGMTPDGARNKMAQDAGKVAVSISAPIAGATGKLVQRFEMNPTARVTPRQLAGNMGREFVEETIQSGTGRSP